MPMPMPMTSAMFAAPVGTGGGDQGRQAQHDSGKEEGEVFHACFLDELEAGSVSKCIAARQIWLDSRRHALTRACNSHRLRSSCWRNSFSRK